MSSLTDKRKKEIDMLYRKMKEKPAKVLLTILFDISSPSENPRILKRIINSIKQMDKIENWTHSTGTNAITLTAQWTESEAEMKVATLKKVEGVEYIQAQILSPL